MITMRNYDDVLHYVNRLGYAGGGAIVHKQKNLCDVANLICKAAGIEGRWPAGVTFEVRQHRYIDDHSRNYWPWKSVFEVVRAGGRRYVAQVKEIDARDPILEVIGRGPLDRDSLFR